MSFWTRGPTGSTFPDRLEVRYSTAGASTNVGTLATDVGDFTNLALEINPTLSLGGYPQIWTQFTLDATDITAGATGRIAFRYFVTNAGPTGANSDYIGIDTFEFCALQEADLTIAKSCTVAGDTVTCDLDVTNLGPAAATNVVVTDTIPTGLTWQSDTCGAGPPAGQVLTWNVGGLAASATVSCTVTMTVDPGVTGDLVNSASVTAENADPDTTNNSADAVIGIGSVLDIPTASTVGLLALALGLALASVVFLRRRTDRV